MDSPRSSPSPVRVGVAAIAVALAAALLDASTLLSPIDARVRDALLRRAADIAPKAAAHGIPDAVVVALDAQSLRARPDWPWPRSHHAQMIDRLHAAGARTIAFDIDFSSPSTPTEDGALAASARAAGGVVFAAFRQRETLEGAGEIEITSVPLPIIANASSGLGSVLVPVDRDGVVREAPVASSIAGQPIRSLALRALEVALGRDSLATEPDTDDAGYFAVDYRRVDPPIRRISAVDVLEGRFDPEWVDGRAVFVGATSAEFQDLWTTPIGPAVPGVEIQAMAYRTAAAQLAGDAALFSPSLPQRAGALLALSLLLAGFARLAQRRRIAAMTAAAVAIGCASLGLALFGSWIVSPLVPWVVVAGHYVLGIEGVQRRTLRHMEAQASSLETLATVGQISTGRSGTRDALEITLGMLGDVVGATFVTLLRATPQGDLDGSRVAWAMSGPRISDTAYSDSACDAQVAQQCLDDGVGLTQPRAPGGRDGVIVYAPLRSDESPIGVLVVECATTRELDLTQQRTIASVGAQLALSAQNLRLIDELRQTFDSSIAAMAGAVEARDGYTNLHCRRLAAFSAIIAERMGMSEGDIHAITLGALLHDVGKIGICDAVLNKRGCFTDEERRLMQRHPETGADIVRPVRGLSQITLECVMHHHERWDGEGYPDGLRADEIPLAARIITVVDVWDALSSERPYKKAYPQEKVLSLLRKGRGVELDPEVVDLFLKVLEEQGDEMLDLIQRDHEELGA